MIVLLLNNAQLYLSVDPSICPGTAVSGNPTKTRVGKMCPHLSNADRDGPDLRPQPVLRHLNHVELLGERHLAEDVLDQGGGKRAQITNKL